MAEEKEEAWFSDALTVPLSPGSPKSPDEAIVGGPFTLLEAGLFGPMAGGAPPWAIEPAREPFRMPEPERDRTLKPYLQGDELPAPGGAAGGAVILLKVEEEDGTPSVPGVDVMKVPNGTLTDLGNGDISLNYESPINKNVANGYAGLDAGSRIAKAQAPSTALYSDDALSSVVTTNTQITSDQNDYPIGSKTFFRLSTDAQRTITGLTGGADGKFLIIRNVGSFNLVLANESASSVAANRIVTGVGHDLLVPPKAAVFLIYDPTDQRWQVI